MATQWVWAFQSIGRSDRSHAVTDFGPRGLSKIAKCGKGNPNVEWKTEPGELTTKKQCRRCANIVEH